MSGDGIQVLAPVSGGEELDFGCDETRVVPAKAPGALPHGVVAAHGVALPQRVLLRQLVFLEGLDQDGRLLVQFFGAAVWRGYLQGRRIKQMASNHSLKLTSAQFFYFLLLHLDRVAKL